MPRFDRGVVNTKLEKGDIVLMGNPTQYGEILAENILIEDILKADLETLISGSNLVRGKFYRITNAVSSTLSLLVQGLTANTICDYAYNTANGDLVTYNISTDLAGVPFSSVYVPYTGATADVNLGEYQIRVGQLELDQTPTGTFGVGKIRWNDTDGTPEVMLKGANVTLQIGQEQLARVVNKTNTNLTEAGYQVVRISGAQGQRLKVGLAQANSTSTCKDTLGLVTENISNNAEGFITTSGLVRNINTTGSLQGETWADGDRLYLSASVAGGITNVEPSAPNIVIVLGYVVYAHANQGSIYVSVEGAKALHELFDVSIPTPTNNNVLVYESSTGLWKDKSISTILGYTPIANNATVGGELSGTLPNPSLVTSAVTGKALTGLSVSGSAVVSTDSILTGIGKLQNQINAVVGSVNFQGVWNASTNSPSLASGVGTKGYYYIVSVAGSTNLDGITDWKLGDWAIYDGTAWQKVDNTDAVVSVNGYTGIVTLAKADIGLGNVENTALSTWGGSGNITTLGTIGTGVWNGTAIGDTYISSASTWNAKIGGSGTTNYIPKFTASGTIGDSVIRENGGNIGINVNPVNAKLEVVATTGEVFRADAAFGAPRIIADQTGVILGGVISTFNTPTTSAGTFDLITHNTSTGVLEKVASNYYATAGSISGTTGKLAKFTSSGAVGDSIVSESGSTITALSSSNTAIVLESTAAFPLYQLKGNYTGGNIWNIEGGRANAGAFEIYDSTLGSTRLVIKKAGGAIITNGATDTGEAHIFGGSVRANGNVTFVGSDRVLDLQGVGAGANSLLRYSDGTTAKYSTGFNNSDYIIFDEVASAYRLQVKSDGTIITANATDTGEHFIIGGSARVNGALTVSTGRTGLFSGDNFSLGLAQTVGQANYFYLGTNSSGDLLMSDTNGVAKLTITQAGAATFSSSVTAASGIFNETASNPTAIIIRNRNQNQTWGLAVDATSVDDKYFALIDQTNGIVQLKVDASTGLSIFNGNIQAPTLKLTSVPTSSAGLSAGDIWSDGGTLKIV